jgi:Tfp pilus assembly protein PilF
MRFNELAVSDKDEEKQQGFAQFISECPKFIPAYIELARSYIKTNDNKKAIETLENAEKLDDKNGDVHYYLGVANELEGNKKVGGAELQKAYDLMPNDDDLQRTITKYRQ